MSLPGVDCVAFPKAEHIKTQYSHSSSLWAAPVNSKQPICVDQMTLALIKLHSVPATPPWWERQERAHLVAWLHGSTWAPLGCRPSALGNPGKLPGPFVSGSTLETINTAAADGKNPPNAAPSAPLFIQPYGQAQMGGKGAVTGQHCLPLIAIRDLEAKPHFL